MELNANMYPSPTHVTIKKGSDVIKFFQWLSTGNFPTALGCEPLARKTLMEVKKKKKIPLNIVQDEKEEQL